MKKLVPLLFLFIPQLAICQSYSSLLSNSGWCCEQYAGTGAVYSEFYVSGDTIIDELPYHVINDLYLLTEDTITKQVWYRNNNELEILYDFTIDIEDTFKIWLHDTNQAIFLVEKIDTVETLSGDLKRWLLKLVDTVFVNNGFIVDDLIWIEGVGSTYGPIYNLTYPFDNEIGGAGTCLEGVYSREREQIYQGYCTEIGGYFPDLCRFISSKVKDVELNQIRAYFSKTGNLLISSDKHVYQISVFDISGRIVYSSRNYNLNSELQIPNNWSSGTYLCRVIFENNLVQTIKLMKGFNCP